MREKALLKEEPAILLFPQEDITVIIIQPEKLRSERAVFLDECIRALKKLLPEMEEHPEPEKGNLMLQPGVWLDEKRRSVWEDGREIPVTRREYDVLHMLFRHRGCVLTYEQIYTRVWKEEYYEGRNSVICLMSRLRKN